MFLALLAKNSNKKEHEGKGNKSKASMRRICLQGNHAEKTVEFMMS